MAKITHRNHLKECCLIIMVALMINLIGISLISSMEVDNVHSFDKNVGEYGKYEIKDWFGLIKLQDLELKSNTIVCSDDCRAEIPINHYQDGILIEDIRFIDNKTGEETNVRSYEFKVNGNDYNLGTKLDKGDYNLELLAEVKAFQVVDWQIKVQGEWLDEWAIFGSSLQDNLIVYYPFDESTGGTAVDSIGFLDATGANISSENWVPGKLNNAVRLNSTNQYFSLDATSFNFGIGNMTLSVWFNATDLTQAVFLGTDVTDGYAIQFLNPTQVRFFEGQVSGDAEFKAESLSGFDDGDWHHLVVVRDGSGVNSRIVLDGVSKTITYPVSPVDYNDGLTYIGAVENSGLPVVNFWNGSLDELGFWDRALLDSEIAELWNSGTPPNFRDIILNSPEENFKTLETTIEFNITSTAEDGRTIVNASLFTNASGNFIRVNETSGLTLQTETVIFNSIFTIGDYIWGAEFCNDLGACVFSENRTLSIVSFSENSKTFNSTALETSAQGFKINITIPSGFTVQSASLIYNGTINTGAIITNTENNDFDISKTITLSQGTQGFVSENRTFSFNITTSNLTSGDIFSLVSSESTQLVNELNFGSCEGSLNISMLNFTMVNEITNIELNASINATTFKATFGIGVNPDNLIKNFTVDEQTTNMSRFNFCTSISTNIFTIDMEAFFTAVGFAEKNYFIEGATLTNETNLINLSMIPDDVGVEFFIDVEQDLFPLTNAIINIQKFFVGEGIFRTVEIDKTDNDGKIVAFLDLNKAYNFAITKDNELLAIIEKTAICEAAPCTILLSITGDTINVYEGFEEAFASNVLYNLSFNGGTKQVLFEFIDTTGLATSFRMDVIKSSSNSTGQIISTQTLFTSAGSMTFNASNETGNFKVETFISRSPAQFIDFITFFINDIGQELGILGLFMAFLTIVVIIFAISFTPRMLVFAVPMALTTVKLMGLVSLSNTALTAIYLLAGVAIAFMSR